VVDARPPQDPIPADTHGNDPHGPRSARGPGRTNRNHTRRGAVGGGLRRGAPAPAVRNLQPSRQSSQIL